MALASACYTILPFAKNIDTSSSVLRKTLNNRDGGTVAGEASRNPLWSECFRTVEMINSPELIATV